MPSGSPASPRFRRLVSPYSGMLVNLLYPQSKNANVSLAGKTHIVFWIKAINENVPAWQGPQPIITLYESDQKFAVLTPKERFSQFPSQQ